MSAFDIELATPDDAQRLSAFCTKQFTDTFGPHLNPTDLALHVERAYHVDKLRAEINRPHTLFLKATDEHGLAAYAYVLWQDRPSHHTPNCLQDPDIGHLERFYVDARCQGTGVAQRLMERCIQHAHMQHASGLWLTVWTQNPRAQRFYQKQQFLDVGEAVFVVGNDPQYDRLYYRPLDLSATPS